MGWLLVLLFVVAGVMVVTAIASGVVHLGLLVVLAGAARREAADEKERRARAVDDDAASANQAEG